MTDDTSPLVSIILPTYNRAHKIPNSIESLIAQTFRNFELIVVDDGSQDNTEQIIDDFRKKDSRIRYVRHPQRKGANAARNRGVREAKGRYIAFQDSDDQWLPHKLSVQIDAIRNTGVQASFTSFWRIQGQKQTHIPKSYRQIKPGIHSFHTDLLEGNFIALPTFVVEKSLFQRTGGFDEGLSRLQDWELFLRLSKLTDFIYINEALVNAYCGSDSITAKRRLYRTSMEYIIKKHQQDFEAHPVALVIQHMNLAVDALKRRDLKRTFIYIAFAFRRGIKPVVTLATQKIMPLLHR